ncbi:MAG: hypothetical protein AVDCRST_MAG19-4295 [uncultured Thermomicrobiales bacterium]|uniref:Uncharacterized protein n=1 Tax=uncultured Thermomicrobiales bacterium TaxID=1645740 RepID=A0A6J4VQN1_9BACT|nr:MAG: hypothetical protein AVDCRST_MAG19-4295 [uncultured Thermomicrobiales bacterium]
MRFAGDRPRSGACVRSETERPLGPPARSAVAPQSRPVGGERAILHERCGDCCDAPGPFMVEGVTTGCLDRAVAGRTLPVGIPRPGASVRR